MAARIYRSFIPPPTPSPYFNCFTYALPPTSQDPHPPSSPAYIDARTGTTVTRGDARRLALEIAYGFTNVLPSLVSPTWDGRLQRGDTVLIYSHNSLAFPLAFHGALAAGLIVSPANSSYTSHELLYQFQDSGAKLILTHPTLVDTALDTLKMAGFSEEEAHARVIVCDYRGLGGHVATSVPSARQFVTLEDLMSKGSISEETDFGGQQVDEIAVLCYSSGTTGKPKGVMISHKNLISVGGMIKSVPIAPEGPQVVAGVLPFFHIGGLSIFMFVTVNEGRPLVVFEKYDALTFIKSIARYKITFLYIVPPIVLHLLQHPAADEHDLSSVCAIFSGAAPLGGHIASALKIKMVERGAKNVAVAQGYGLTETSPAVTITPRDWAERKYESSGCLLPQIEARLVGEDGVTDAPEGGPGELWVRGPNVMKGYLNRPDATRESITPDGWFKTGDVATCDSDGFFAIIDRQKELIKYNGFQVPPAELESVLLEHPGIVDAAVVGIQDPQRATELPRAYVVPAASEILRTSAAMSAFSAEVKNWFQNKVANHKYLRGGCVVVDTIPKSLSGKILRRELRLRAAEEQIEKPVSRAKL